jgi:hypothetical protein
MPTRKEVFDVVDGEREYQEQGKGAARTDRSTTTETVGDGIVIMESYLAKARDAYSKAHPEGREEALHQLRKVVALGVKTMEIHGAPARV